MDHCHLCGAEASQDARFCGQCGAELPRRIPDQNNPPSAPEQNNAPPLSPGVESQRKRNPGCGCVVLGVLATLAILVVLILVVGALVPATSSTVATHSDEPNATAEPTAQPYSLNINGTTENGTIVDNTAYVVYKYSLRKNIGGDSYSAGATASGMFLTVRVRVLNLGHETRDIMLSSSTLVDDSGNSFDTSSDGMSALSMNGDANAELMGTQIEPGLSKDVDVVFDVTPTDKRFTLVIPSGLFSSDPPGKIQFHIY